MNEQQAILDQALTQSHWDHTNLQLVRKMLTEFLYEEMISTEIKTISPTKYEHTLNISSDLYYRFTAAPRILGNWAINPNSIVRYANQSETHVSVAQFLLDTHAIIGIPGLTLGHLIRELNHTLIADCHALSSQKTITCDDIIFFSHEKIEGLMQGHPWFVVNKGRLGMTYAEYLQYAPERQQSIQLAWIAVKKSHAHFNAISELNYEKIISQELSISDQQKWAQLLTTKHLAADDYYFMPVHEWQWQHQLISLFPQDLVEQNLVYLGQSDDQYLPTQAIRTFMNQTDHTKYQVKLPMSIFNTAVYRGLPSERTQHAPLLSQWLRQKYHDDSFFHEGRRLILLGEIASIDYPHPHYADLPHIPYQYKELLGVIWRENVNTYLKPEEQVITMAALIHVDHAHQTLISSLVKHSGLTLHQWLAEFFQATLPSLLHWLYQYGLVFSPHAENTLLIIENFRPVGLVIKDFIDDINLSHTNLPEINDLPDSLQSILLRVEDHQLTQFIHTGLFVVVYRYLSDILCSHHDFSEADFWAMVQEVILDYQKNHPYLEKRFQQFDLLKPTFNKMCLNRLRLLSVGYADYAERPKVDTINPMQNPVNSAVIHAWRTMNLAEELA